MLATVCDLHVTSLVSAASLLLPCTQDNTLTFMPSGWIASCFDSISCVHSAVHPLIPRDAISLHLVDAFERNLAQVFTT